MWACRWLVVSAVLGMGASLFAKPEFWDQYQKAQAMEPRARMEAAECRNCHTSPPRRNPFGRQVEEAMEKAGNEEVTTALLTSIAGEDADGDGATNEEEWKADTLPGDPDSKPGGGNEIAPSNPDEGRATPQQPNIGARGPGGGNREPGFQDGEGRRLGVDVQEASPSGRASQSNTGGGGGAGGGAANIANEGTPSSSFLPEHAFHPAIVHFPIALFIVGVFLDILGRVKRNDTLREAGWWNMLIGSVSSLLAAGTGLIARDLTGYEWNEADFYAHFVLAVASIVLMAAATGMRRSNMRDSWVYFLTAIVAAVAVGAAGHYGFTLVRG
jgi:uncharacterized membrane protein